MMIVSEQQINNENKLSLVSCLQEEKSMSEPSIATAVTQRNTDDDAKQKSRQT